MPSIIGTGVGTVFKRPINLSSYLTPQNVIITPIPGGIRITWTVRNNTLETEIYVSIDGGAYTLLTTTGLTIGTYDYTCDTGAHTYLFELRSKFDQTILNTPINPVTSEISAGVIRITWDDNNTESDHIELWADIASVGYALITTLNTGVETYDHTVGIGTNVKYKLRAKEGTLPVYSVYSSISEITTTSPTSYTNTGGTGDRRAIITLTKSGFTIGDGLLNQLVDGATTYFGIYVGGGGVLNQYINFDFGVGVSKIIDEAKYYWAYGTSVNGTWKWQGSNNGTDYTDIGSSFSLTQGVITTLAGNITGYRHYRILGVSGNFSATYLCEFEFKIKDA
jgi:hypothetical protein